jgi:hypothetical protein
VKLTIIHQPWEKLPYGVYIIAQSEEVKRAADPERSSMFSRMLIPEGRFDTEEAARGWCAVRSKGERVVAEYDLP